MTFAKSESLRNKNTIEKIRGLLDLGDKFYKNKLV